MKLYEVTFTQTLLVLAEDEKEARAVGRWYRDDEDAQIDVVHARTIPANWDSDCLVYGRPSAPEMTAADAIEKFGAKR